MTELVRPTHLHQWVKAPKSLFALWICRKCGRDTMVKHHGKCST